MGVSVDPDMVDYMMEDYPLQAESDDLFIFPSMSLRKALLVISVYVKLLLICHIYIRTRTLVAQRHHLILGILVE